jgi:hypothetical protein
MERLFVILFKQMVLHLGEQFGCREDHGKIGGVRRSLQENASRNVHARRAASRGHQDGEISEVSGFSLSIHWS